MTTFALAHPYLTTLIIILCVSQICDAFIAVNTAEKPEQEDDDNAE